MEGKFDYEDVFMGVLRTFKSDYRLKRLTEAVLLKKGKMLDIGCAGGIFTESLVKYYPHVQVYGCDVSKTAIYYAKKLGSEKVKYNVIKGKRLPYKSNFFDVCVCLDVMEHVPDVDFFLKEVKRILKKNGQFFLLVPCEGQAFTFTWLFQKIKMGNKMTYQNWGHIHPEFTHKNVTQLLTDKGFSIKRTTYSEHIFWQIVSLLVYFWPKEILAFFLGKKAQEYSDSGVIRAKDKGKEKKNIIMLARKIFLGFNTILRELTYWETDIFKKTPLTAWKIHLLTQNNKK